MLNLALTLLIGAQPAEVRLLRNPDVYGDTVVFNYATDLWVMNTKDGIARRLTSHPGTESRARFSPDGKQISFTGTYDGNADIYVVDTDGGEPKRLTFNGGPDLNQDWTPDGKIAFSSAMGTYTNRNMRLSVVSPNGSMPELTPIQEIAELSYSPDGKTLAYNRANSQPFNWRRYRGGTQGRISFYNFAENKYWELPAGREQSYSPMWVGNKVFYISDKDFGTRNLFAADVDSKKATRLTSFKDADIKFPATDGKTIVWERDGFLESYDIRSEKVTRVKAYIPTDNVASRPRLRNVGDSIGGFDLGPTGQRLMIDGRGDIFSVPARSGDTRNLTETQGVREQNPDWSPDGKLVAYISDASGEKQLYTRPQMGGEAKKITVDKLINGFQWTPDGKGFLYTTSDGRLIHKDGATGAETMIFKNDWQANPVYDMSQDGSTIAYCKPGNNLQSSIYLYDVATKKATKITEGYYDDANLSFDMNGKFLYVVSTRTFAPTGGAFEFMMNMQAGQRVYAISLDKSTPNPMMRPGDEEPTGEEGAPAQPAGEPSKKMKIDYDGIEDRFIPLPFAPANYAVVGVSNGVLVFSQSGITLWSFAARAPLPIYEGPLFNASLNDKRNKMAIQTPLGISIMGVAPGQDPNAGKVSTAGMDMMWDPRAEWKQIFNEVWRWERDVYYDPNMLGLDWNAIGKQYEAYLPYINHHTDLNYVLGGLIGELGTGHAYVSGGEMGDMGRPVPVGHLGADYAVSGGFVKFAKVYKGLNFEEGRRGPLGDIGVDVKDGDYLLEIDGAKVTANQDLHALMQNKVGKTVTITVNGSPTMTGARKYKVRPIANETELRYISWVEKNRKYVAAKTGGKIGYLHIPDTSIPGVIEFMKGFYSQTDKEGWIFDERNNGGGMIPTFFVEFLQREVVAKMKARNWNDIGFPVGTLEGAKVMMINENAGSGGDMLPWLFREAKLGPLVGTRTWGGLVGIQGGAPLVDGTSVTAPGFGIYDHKAGKWIAENEGISPDVQVDLRPDMLARGIDAQLDKAIEVVVDLAKKQRRDSKTPAFPRPKPGQ